MGAGSRKKERTGQDRTVKKVTKALYFTYLGRSPHWTDFHKKNCTVVAAPYVITFANFWAESFRGYNFTGGWISRFPIESCMCLTTVQRYCAACDRSKSAYFEGCGSLLANIWQGMGHRPSTSVGVRKLEWLPFRVVSKYPQSIV